MPAKMLVKAADSPVPDGPGKWLAGEVVVIVEVGATLGSGEEVAGGSFFHATISDQTVLDMQYVLQQWNRNLVIVNTTPTAPSGLRDISITNSLVSATGIGLWTPTITSDILTQWNSGNPSLTLTNDAIISPSVWNASVILPTEPDEIAFDEFITRYGIGSLVKRKLLYITSAGMTAIENNGGSITWTAAELSPFLRDGLLD